MATRSTISPRNAHASAPSFPVISGYDVIFTALPPWAGTVHRAIGFLALIGTPAPARHGCLRPLPAAGRRNGVRGRGGGRHEARRGHDPRQAATSSVSASAEGSCKMVVQKAVAVAVCMGEDAHIRVRSPRRGRTDGDDSTPLEPRGQWSQRRGLLLAGTGSPDGRRGQRELAAVARTRSPGLDVLSACRHPLAGHEAKAGSRGPGFRRRHRAEVGRRRLRGRC